MTAILILLIIIFTLSVAGIAGYMLIFGRRFWPNLNLNENVVRNISNASFMLAMIFFLGLVFYLPVAFPPDKTKPSAKIEGNINMSAEQIKYQRKYNMETFGVTKTEGNIAYPLKAKDPADHLMKLNKNEPGLKMSGPQPYDEIWSNAASNYKVYWNKGAFVVEIGYYDEAHPEWVMDRETFMSLKEEGF